MTHTIVGRDLTSAFEALQAAVAPGAFTRDPAALAGRAVDASFIPPEGDPVALADVAASPAAAMAAPTAYAARSGAWNVVPST